MIRGVVEVSLSPKARYIHLNMLGNFKEEMDSNFYGSVGYRYPIHSPPSFMRCGDIRVLLIRTGSTHTGEGKLL